MILSKNKLSAKQREKRKFVPLNTEVVAESIRQRIDTVFKHRQSDRICKELKIALTLKSDLLIPYLDSIRGFDLGYKVYVDEEGKYFRAKTINPE